MHFPPQPDGVLGFRLTPCRTAHPAAQPTRGMSPQARTRRPTHRRTVHPTGRRPAEGQRTIRVEPLEDRSQPSAATWDGVIPAAPLAAASIISGPTSFEDAAALEPAANGAAAHTITRAVPAQSLGVSVEVGPPRRELYLVTFDVPDRDMLVRDILTQPGNTAREVVALSGDVGEITAILAGRSGLDAIHLVSHGAPGRVWLGDDALDDATLSADSADFRAWGAALNPGGDLLLYGCDVAAGDGQAFVTELARLTGADVAASTDRTGAAGTGGNWVLEYATGTIETTTLAPVGWAHALPTVNFQQGVNGYSGTSDTFLDSHHPTAARGGEDHLHAEGGPEPLQVLLRFDDIIGAGPGQIPPGATVTAASLEVYVTDTATASAASFHRMLVPWAESSTWASLGGGVQLDETEASGAADAVFLNTGGKKDQTVNGLSDAVQAWADGAPNFGWVLVSDNAKWGFNSSEKNENKSPQLVVTYTTTNRIPVATGDSYATAEDTPLVVPAAMGLLATGTDADGDALTVTLASGPAHGVVSVNLDGSFTYIPAADYSGTDSFTYTVSDGRGGAALGTVDLTVTAVNDAPTANDDRYTTRVNLIVLTVPLTVTTPGVLANDTDADRDPLTAQLLTSPANGLLSYNADGSFTYTAVLNFAGSDSFTYRVFDGTVWSAPATVFITVSSPNQPPAAAADTFTTTEDTPLVVAGPGLLTNDTDPNGDTLYVVLNVGPAHGTLDLRSDGGFTYTPAADWSGTDAFTYHVSDGSLTSAPVTVTLTVTAVDDPPTIGPIADHTISEDSPSLTVALSGVSAGGGESQALTITATSSNPTLIPNPPVQYTTATAVLSLQPVADGNGTATITVTVSDGTNTTTRTFTIAVRPANDDPTAADDTTTTDEGAAVTIAVLSNDVDIDGDTLVVTVVGAATNGAVTTDGVTVTYTPAAGWSGTDTFTYTLSDENGGTATATVTVVVRPLAVANPDPTPSDPPPTDPAPTDPSPTDSTPSDPPTVTPAPTPPTPTTPAPAGPPIDTPTETITAGTVLGATGPNDVVTAATGGVTTVTNAVTHGAADRWSTVSNAGRVYGTDAPAAAVGVPEAPEPRAALPVTPNPVPPPQSPTPSSAPVLPPSPPAVFVAPAAPPVTVPAAELVPPAAILAAIDQVRTDLRADVTARATTDTIVVSGGVAVAGYALLNTRAVYWFLSALLARPAVWRRFDPLDVVYAWERDRGRTPRAADPDESLQTMVG